MSALHQQVLPLASPRKSHHGNLSLAASFLCRMLTCLASASWDWKSFSWNQRITLCSYCDLICRDRPVAMDKWLWNHNSYNGNRPCLVTGLQQTYMTCVRAAVPNAWHLSLLHESGLLPGAACYSINLIQNGCRMTSCQMTKPSTYTELRQGWHRA